MLKLTGAAATMAGLMITMIGFAQAPSGAPAGSTGQCKDGTYWSGVVKKGACHGHKGVQAWYGDAASAGASNAAGTKSTAAGAGAPPVPAAAATPPAAAPTATPSATSKGAAPGGGAGQVWINKNTKVYHCSTDKWYGKTKNGAYVSETEAKAQGFHPDHGKACQ